MIDFRYHLVSLMAVLIALTLGVVLGAGPLQGKISDSISGEVQRLSAQQTKLQEEKEQLIVETKTDKQYLGAYADSHIKGILKDKKVAILKVGTVPESIVKNQIQAIEKSGATVIAKASIDSGWTVSAGQKYRQSLLPAIKEKLSDTLLIHSDTDDYILSLGLVEAVSNNSEKATAIKEMLVKTFKAGNNDYSLVRIEQAPSGAADAIVVLSAPIDKNDKDSKDKTKSKEIELSQAALKGLVSAFTAKQGRAVVFAGSAKEEDDLIAQIRALQLQVSTVDSISNQVSQPVVVMALNSNLKGQVGAYGVERGATGLIPPVKVAE